MTSFLPPLKHSLNCFINLHRTHLTLTNSLSTIEDLPVSHFSFDIKATSAKMCLVTTVRYLCEHDGLILPTFEICNDIPVPEFTSAHDLSTCRNFRRDEEVLQRNCPQCELALEKIRRKAQKEARKRAEKAAKQAERAERLPYRRVSSSECSFDED